jgi:hypothetical protein
LPKVCLLLFRPGETVKITMDAIATQLGVNKGTISRDLKELLHDATTQPRKSERGSRDLKEFVHDAQTQLRNPTPRSRDLAFATTQLAFDDHVGRGCDQGHHSAN